MFGIRAFSLAACAAVFFLALPAQAGLFDDDEARKAILDLRQRIDAASRVTEAANRATEAANRATDQRITDEAAKLRDENGTLKRGLLDLQNQIEALKADLARLRGQDEQLARDVAEMQRRQKDIAQGVDDRLRKFEPVKVSVDGQDFLADPAEKRDFEAALATFRKGEFAGAQTGFLDFARRYPTSGYLPAVLFWLGNAQYATRDYPAAVTNFRALIAAAPQHLRAPEAALSIANCQVELKDLKAARKTLEDLIKVYPASEAAVAAKDRLSKMR